MENVFMLYRILYTVRNRQIQVYVKLLIPQLVEKQETYPAKRSLILLVILSVETH
jgi:hypothetical protein